MIFTFFIISINTFAQDLIVKKNGEEVNAKIIEVGTKEVKYKNSTNIEGPTYTIDKSEIVFVKYKNGEKEIFENSSVVKINSNPSEYLSIGSGFYRGDTKISKKEFKQILATNEKAFREYKSGKTISTLGLILAIPSAAVVGYSLGSKSDDKTPLIAGGLVCVGGYLCVIAGNIQVKNAVKTYNKSKGMTLNLNINSNGIGLAMKF